MDKSKCKYYLCPEKFRAPRTEYIIDAIGDVELDEKTYELFLQQWQCSGGVYDVRTKRETFKGIYDISQRFQFLTVDALDEIWFRYISDLFKEYYLEDTLEMFFDRFGKEDKTFKLFLSFIDQIAKEHHQKYIDEAQLKEIVESTRIYFGTCDPISYQMVENLVTGEGLDYYPEQPQYMICGTRKIDTTFTKQEFLESIEKRKVKKLERK